MGVLIVGLSAICGLVSLGCWIFTIIKAFTSGDTVVGILSICPLIGFIMGWVNASKWGHTPVMLVWSGCVVLNIILNVAAQGLQQ